VVWASTFAGRFGVVRGISLRPGALHASVGPGRPARRTQVSSGELKQLTAASSIDCVPFSNGANQLQDQGAACPAAPVPIVCTDDSPSSRAPPVA